MLPMDNTGSTSISGILPELASSHPQCNLMCHGYTCAPPSHISCGPMDYLPVVLKPEPTPNWSVGHSKLELMAGNIVYLTMYVVHIVYNSYNPVAVYLNIVTCHVLTVVSIFSVQNSVYPNLHVVHSVNNSCYLVSLFSSYQVIIPGLYCCFNFFYELYYHALALSTISRTYLHHCTSHHSIHINYHHSRAFKCKCSRLSDSTNPGKLPLCSSAPPWGLT